MNIGSVIRIKREEAGLTQQKLGELLFVSRQSVSRWESGSRTPDLTMLKKIASVLKISNDELLTFADEGVIYNARGNNDKIRIFAGFDCGGSNTRCMLVSEEGTVLGVGRGGPSNYSFCGKLVAAESIRQSIREAFADAKMQPSKISGIFVASAAVEVFCGGEHEEFFKEVTGCTYQFAFIFCFCNCLFIVHFIHTDCSLFLVNKQYRKRQLKSSITC